MERLLLRLIFVCVLACFGAQAGIVQGVVVEHLSGRPMARARVRLDPVQKAGVVLKPQIMRTGIGGQFLFQDVPSGLYILTSVRDNYFPASYGQRRPSGMGLPFEVTKDSDFFTQLQMWRKGAITGRVLDENGIGVDGVAVIAYRTRLPLRAAARGVSDERGVYRIHGLEPGKYWIRSVPHEYDDGSGILPTFGPESRELSQAKAHEVRLDSDTPDADVRPEGGRLFRAGGSLQCKDDGIPVLVTLSSETLTRTVESSCRGGFLFEGLAPAYYEISAVKRGGIESGFVELFMDRAPRGPLSIMLTPPAPVEFEVRLAGTQAPSNIAVKLSGHRQNLSGALPEREIETRGAMLEAGTWEITGQAGPGMYIESITGFRSGARRARDFTPPSDAFSVFVDTSFPTRVRVIVSDQAGRLGGVVKGADGKTVPGAPVFLWPVAEAARRSLRGSLMILTDVDGRYQFDGLPPGDYRVAATFDWSEVEEASFEEAKAVTVKVDASRQVTSDLLLWNAP